MSTTTIQATDVNTLVQQALQTANDASSAATNSSIGQDIANSLTNSSASIQSIVNSITQNQGVITADQLSQLNQEMATAKLNTLKAQTQSTFTKYGIYIGGFIFLFGVLWLLTKKTTKDGQ